MLRFLVWNIQDWLHRTGPDIWGNRGKKCLKAITAGHPYCDYYWKVCTGVPASLISILQPSRNKMKAQRHDMKKTILSPNGTANTKFTPNTTGKNSSSFWQRKVGGSTNLKAIHAQGAVAEHSALRCGQGNDFACEWIEQEKTQVKNDRSWLVSKPIFSTTWIMKPKTI